MIVLMKKSFDLLILLGLAISVPAQTDLQKCSEEMGKKISEIEGHRKDKGTITKNLTDLDKEWTDCVVGKPIPDFTVETIKKEKISREELKGKVIVINFWSTGCLPCITEMPAFNKLVEEYDKKNVEFLGFNVNYKKGLKKFLKKREFRFKIVPNSLSVATLFGIVAYPATFIVDQNGDIKFGWVGGDNEEKAKTAAYDKAKPVIDGLLKTQ
jgi:peroxiredoxin